MSGRWRRRPPTRLPPRPWRGRRYCRRPSRSRSSRSRSRRLAGCCGCGPGWPARRTCFGRGLLSVLSREHLDDDAWEEIEEALLTADVGVGATTEIVDRLRDRTKVLGTRSTGELRALLAEELVAALQPDLDRTLQTLPHDGRPAVLLVVGVNGTGKTTTCGKLARVLVADGRTVLLGAADTFRAAAADQLADLGVAGRRRDRARARRAATRPSVAFDAVKQGTDRARRHRR